MLVGEVCNREVVVVDKDASTQVAIGLMREHHVGDVVVVEDRLGQRVPIGILTDRDVVIELLAEDVELDAVSVGDVMSYQLHVAREGDEITNTIHKMKSKGIRRLPVVNEQGGLIGILALDDIIEIMAELMDDLASLVRKERKKEKKTRK
jgi:CBS domain-containing protein